ncbi:MAG: cupin domain-containing protein [Gammaproteobacteria bacterium]|nr:cupin domain-containing protein [Gammaproteobacteria bacterium]MBI5614796.1 cupin domain-containing protein [Gammaproteobacteria bacterium]
MSKSDSKATPGQDPDTPAHAPTRSGETGELDGAEIRALRKARSMSLVELARRADLSIGYISQIERNCSTPSVKALGAIARALGVTIGWFFSAGSAGPGDEKGIVLRKQHRRRIGFRDGFVDYLLSPDLEGEIEMLLTHFSVGASTGEPYTHRGEESGLVLKGRLEITVGDRTFVLEEGDSFRFSSTEPHRYRNAYDGETILVAALTPPSY